MLMTRIQATPVESAAARAGLVVALGALLLALVVGCSHRQRDTMNQREYAPYRGLGSATIQGQVTMTLDDGTRLVGSACEVRLTPITDDSTKYIKDVVMTGGTKKWKGDTNSVWWIEVANDQGEFRFREVPAGSYYLTCPVAWRDPKTGSARERILWAETTVGANETVDVVVTR
jgi:hypothetical protein